MNHRDLPKVLVAGGTGYIGGGVLEVLQHAKLPAISKWKQFKKPFLRSKARSSASWRVVIVPACSSTSVRPALRRPHDVYESAHHRKKENSSSSAHLSPVQTSPEM